MKILTFIALSAFLPNSRRKRVYEDLTYILYNTLKFHEDLVYYIQLFSQLKQIVKNIEETVFYELWNTNEWGSTVFCY